MTSLNGGLRSRGTRRRALARLLLVVSIALMAAGMLRPHGLVLAAGLVAAGVAASLMSAHSGRW
jgi:hypothetical protein